MYCPVVTSCSCCEGAASAAEKFRRLTDGKEVTKTGQLYRIPYASSSSERAHSCVIWPKYDGIDFKLDNEGVSMLELTQDERRSLQIVVLRTQVQSIRYGAAHHCNFKKMGLSRAYFKSALVTRESLPTARARAAYDFLMKNKYYDLMWKEHKSRLESNASLNISSFDLFINMKGIEAAMYPVVYPTTAFTDTGFSSSSSSSTSSIPISRLVGSYVPWNSMGH